MSRQQLCQTEIQDLCLPVPGHKEVGRLDVAVHNAAPVCRLQRSGNLQSQRQQFLQFHRPFGQNVFERLALQQLHGNEWAALMLANLIDGANIGMVQCRRGAGFLLEALQRLCFLAVLRRQELQRYVSL
jgi:hypothetical protein